MFLDNPNELKRTATLPLEDVSPRRALYLHDNATFGRTLTDGIDERRGAGDTLIKLLKQQPWNSRENSWVPESTIGESSQAENMR